MALLRTVYSAVVKLGSAYVKHAQFVGVLLSAAPQQRTGMLAEYAAGLTPADLVGFRLCLQVLATRAATGEDKAALMALVADAQSIAPGARLQATEPDDEAAFVQTCELYHSLAAMESDAERSSELTRFLGALDWDGLSRFEGHLNRMDQELNEAIAQFQGSDISAWGNSFEDRAAYGMAHLRAPAPSPTTQKTLDELRLGQAIVEQMRQAKSVATGKLRLARLGAQASVAANILARAVGTVASHAQDRIAAAQPQVPHVAQPQVPYAEPASAAVPAMPATADGNDPRVARIIDIFTRQDRSARLRFVEDGPKVPLPPTLLQAFESGYPEVEGMALCMLANIYCRNSAAAEGIETARAVYAMAQAAATGSAADPMVEVAAQAAIVVLLGYNMTGAAGNAAHFGHDASVWLGARGDVTHKAPLLMARIEAHLSLSQFDEAGRLLDLAEAVDIPADQPADSQRLRDLRKMHARLAATEPTALPSRLSDDEKHGQDKQDLAERVAQLQALAAGSVKPDPANSSMPGVNVAEMSALADMLQRKLADSGSKSEMQWALDAQPIADHMDEMLNGVEGGMTKGRNRNRIAKAGLIFADPATANDPASIDLALEVLLEARQWACDNDLARDEANALWPIYLCYSRTGRPEQAIDALQALWANLEQQRSRIADPMKRAGIMGDFPKLFSALCWKLHGASRNAELLDAIEGAKGRWIADVLTRAQETPVSDAGLRASAATIHAALAPLKAHYLSFMVDDEETYAVLVAKDGTLHGQTVPIGAHFLRNIVGSINPKGWGQLPLGAFGGNIAPLSDQLKGLVSWLEPLLQSGVIEPGDHICYSPDDVLHLVPLHYLPVAGAPLVRHVSLSRIHGAAALLALLQRPAERPTRFVAVHVPAQDEIADSIKVGALARAPKWLADNLTGTILGGAGADLAALSDLKLDRRLVHFSTHGTFPGKKRPHANPFFSAGIVLASGGALPSLEAADRGECTDIMLTPARALEPDFAVTGSHVTLQACVTGLSRDGIGGDALGLDLAMLLAGAQSLLTTHWELGAVPSADFCVRFYDKWLRDKHTRAAAWRETVLEIAEQNGPRDFADEYYWASVSLSGDFR